MEKTLLIKGKAGLGNRVLATLCGIVFGAITGRRIIVDWRDGTYAPPGTNAFPLLFASPFVTAGDVDPLSRNVAPQIWRDHLDWTVSNMIGKFDPNRFSDPTVYRKYCCDLSRIDHPEDLIVYWSYLPKFHRIAKHFKGDFACYRGLSQHRLIGELMPKYLPLQPHLVSLVETFAAAHFRAPMVGVHIRYSDRSTPLRRVHADLTRVLAAEPQATIFLATDNRAIEEQFESRYQRLVLAEKWLPPAGQQIHYNPADADPEASAIAALKDMYLLSRCDYLIYPRRSTFSYFAHCIGNFEKGRAIDVERHDLVLLSKRFVQDHI